VGREESGVEPLPLLLSPVTLTAILFQNPFADVEAMSWYSALVMYGCHDTGGALLVEDSDIKLIPSIIEKVLLPKLTGIPILSIFNDGCNAQSDHRHNTASRGAMKTKTRKGRIIWNHVAGKCWDLLA